MITPNSELSEPSESSEFSEPSEILGTPGQSWLSEDQGQLGSSPGGLRPRVRQQISHGNSEVRFVEGLVS